MILVVQKDLTSATNFIDKLLIAGYQEDKIASTINVDDIDRYLKSDNFSYLIIDATLYNFRISSIISKYEIKTIITNATNAQKTIRMITDKNISYTTSGVCPEKLIELVTPKELTPFERVSV